MPILPSHPTVSPVPVQYFCLFQHSCISCLNRAQEDALSCFKRTQGSPVLSMPGQAHCRWAVGMLASVPFHEQWWPLGGVCITARFGGLLLLLPKRSLVLAPSPESKGQGPCSEGQGSRTPVAQPSGVCAPAVSLPKLSRALLLKLGEKLSS